MSRNIPSKQRAIQDKKNALPELYHKLKKLKVNPQRDPLVSHVAISHALFDTHRNPLFSRGGWPRICECLPWLSKYGCPFQLVEHSEFIDFYSNLLVFIPPKKCNFFYNEYKGVKRGINTTYNTLRGVFRT